MTATPEPGRGERAPDQVRPVTTEHVIADHAALVGRPDHWVRTLLRTQSVTGREILARVASRGALDAAALEALPSDPDREAVLERLNPATAGAYARVLAHQPGNPEAVTAAVALLALLLDSDGRRRVAATDVALYAQLLVLQRRWAELRTFLDRGDLAARVPDDIRAALLADLANPFLGSGHDSLGFLGAFNEVIAPGGDHVVTLADSGVTAFDRLTSVPSGTHRGPLVTVVTSAYNPDHALLLAARSMVDQTWQDWEMLIVDDASTEPASQAVLAQAERLDPRIRVIRKAVNGGTYRARNTAMRQARGEFVTFLDSDDWAHPHRLATGIGPMLEHAGVVATHTYGTRVTEDLELTRPGYAPHFVAAASLMFRFPDVPARIGFFDPARKAADTEYLRRIEAGFGRPVLGIPGSALTLLRRSTDSLSAEDFSYGWRHPSRWAYKQSYAALHRRIAAGEPAFVEGGGGSTHFGPTRWDKPGDPGRRATRHLDVVLAGDWRRYGGPQVSMMEEITSLRAQGLRVGVLHMEAMRFRTERDEPLCEPLQARLRAGEVELVFLDDDVDVDLVILRYPPILQFPPAVRRSLRPRRLLIMANQAPAEPDGSDQRYVPADVHRHGLELFGTEPVWVPQGPTIRRVLDGLLPPHVIAPWDNQGIIDPAAWYTERGALPREGLVVGRYSRDAAIKFPGEAADLLTGYGFPPGVHVRFMGATRTVSRMLADSGTEQPGNWTVLEERSLPAPEFLASVDVVVYLDNPDANEAFGRVLLESAASGALVIASPKHEPTFGDALLYAEPAEAVALVERLVADPAAVARQRETTRRRVEERWSHLTFARRIVAELAEVRQRGDRAEGAVLPAGEVRLARAGGARPLVAQVHAGEVAVRSAPLRRDADAELSDAVAVVHALGAERVADDLLTDVRATHRPGRTALAADLGDLPAGVCAVVFHVDGAWWPTVGPGWDAVADAGGCRLVSRP